MKRNGDFIYLKLYRLLREQIMNGLIKPGEFIMPESALCKQYGMSRKSVRRALDELLKEGMIAKRVGLGTFVPPDFSIPAADRKVLRILAPYPAFFVDSGLPYICDAFRRKHPGVDINVLSLPAARYWDSILQSERMGYNPHVVFCSDRIYRELEAESTFVDLEPLLGDALSGVYPKIRNAFRREEGIAAAPITFTPVCLAYNPELFAAGDIPPPKPHWNVNDFMNAAESLTSAHDGKINRYGFSFFSSYNRWLVFALQNGMRPSGKNNKQIISGSLSVLQDWLNRRRISTVYHDNMNLANPFIHGKSAMTLTTLFEMSSWGDRELGFAPEIAPLPFGDTKSTLMQANFLMVPKANEEVELSMDFVKTALEAEVQKTICDRTPFLSVLEAVNLAVRSQAYLRTINVGNGLIDRNYFMHELIESADQAELRAEMSLFWLGLEDAETIAERF
ncbi:extracellular solute-binding protein [Paenibacillus hemerocallicola]|nr:extracellular solute-binding protein [Paenibacillus hemerocallicola]